MKIKHKSESGLADTDVVEFIRDDQAEFRFYEVRFDPVGWSARNFRRYRCREEAVEYALELADRGKAGSKSVTNVRLRTVKVRTETQDEKVVAHD